MVALHVCQVWWTLAYNPLRTRRHKSRRTLCQRRSVRACVHSVGMLCGYMPNSSLRISGHLPAPIVNGGGDRFWKWKEFKLWRARDLDLDLGSGHTAYRRASLIDLYVHTKFHSNRRNCLWTDGRTYGHFPHLILLGRLLEVDLKIDGLPVIESDPRRTAKLLGTMNLPAGTG